MTLNQRLFIIVPLVSMLLVFGALDPMTQAGQWGAFFVLVGALMQSVLVEMGYLSNPADAATLSDAAKQKRIADNLAKAIDEFRRTRR